VLSHGTPPLESREPLWNVASSDLLSGAATSEEEEAGEWVEIAASKGDQLEASRPAGGYEVKQITFGKSPDVGGSAFDASWLPAGEQQHSIV